MKRSRMGFYVCGFVLVVAVFTLSPVMQQAVEGGSDNKPYVSYEDLMEMGRIQIFEALKPLVENPDVPLPSNLTICVEMTRSFGGAQTGEWEYWLFTEDEVRLRRSLHNAESGKRGVPKMTPELIEKFGVKDYAYGDYDRYFHKKPEAGSWRELVSASMQHDLWDYEQVFIGCGLMGPVKRYRIQIALGDVYWESRLDVEGMSYEPSVSQAKVIGFVDGLLSDAAKNLRPLKSRRQVKAIDRELTELQLMLRDVLLSDSNPPPE